MSAKIVALLLGGALLCAAAVKDMSGVWTLDVQKSHWGKKKPPIRGSIMIEHAEPKFKYKGEVQTGADQTLQFTFDGAIDGKEYDVREDNYTRKAAFKRKSDSVIESTTKSSDGKSVEEATTVISNDGKTLTRRVRLKAPEGTASWTEVYTK